MAAAIEPMVGKRHTKVRRDVRDAAKLLTDCRSSLNPELGAHGNSMSCSTLAPTNLDDLPAEF